MNETRRHLLILGALTAASTTLPFKAFGKTASKPVPATTPPTENEYDALATLTPADFAPFVGATFTTQSEDGHSVHMTLVEVQTPPTQATTSSQPPATPNPGIYALRFKHASGKLLMQATYVLTNSGLEPFAIFLVPSSASKPIYYTGQVNRSVQ
jgi:Domain of unknown function (DUF6916)